MTVGCDVSEYQRSPLPWAQWRDAGLRFAILRASIGYIVDGEYRRHAPQASAAGVEFAVYHALLKHNPPNSWDTHPPMQFDGAQQARAFVQCIGPADVFPPMVIDGTPAPRYWVDVEAEDTDAALLTAFLAEWHRLRPVAAIGIYSSKYAWENLIGHGRTEFAHYALWVADYDQRPPRLPDIWTQALIHQFHTQAGYLPGFDKDLDIDELIPTETNMPVTLTDAQAKSIGDWMGTMLLHLTEYKANMVVNSAWAQGEMNNIVVLRPLLVTTPPPPPPVLHTMATMTNQAVIDLFHKVFPTADYFDNYITRAGIAGIAGNRKALYVGPAVENLTLTDAEKQALLNGLGVAVG